MKYYKLISQTSDNTWVEQDGTPMKIGRIVASNEIINGATMEYWIEGQEYYWQEVPAGNYFVQKGKMPEYFAIKRVANDPLWEKYIDWLNKTYSDKWESCNDSYFRYDGISEFNGITHYRDITSFSNNPIELTLEQWDKIVNKTMEEEFKLPENWYIDVTDDNVDMLNKWYKYCTLTNEYLVGMSKWKDGGTKKGHNFKGRTKGKTYDFGTKITTEQFIKYVLKEDIMEEFKLPEKWCVKPCKETSEWFNANSQTNARDYHTVDYGYLHYPKVTEFFHHCDNIQNGYTEITYSQFIKYVLKEEVMKENDKEIIGWKLKDSCEQYTKAALNIINESKFYIFAEGYNFSTNSTNESDLKKAGVLELWFEPVYPQKFKVGDWVTVEKYPDYWASLLNKNCPENAKYPLIGQITKMQDDNSYTGIELCNYGFDLISLIQKNLIKLATPEEIKVAQTPQITINGYKGEFFKDYVKFGCQKFTPEFVIRLFELQNDFKIDLSSYTEEIKQIAEYYNKK